MKLEKALFSRSYIWFTVFFGAVVLAFWYTYFTRLLDQENYRMHLHGLALILWCLLLISQAYLIRTNHRTLHRQMGKFSYILVPFIMFTTISLLRYRLRDLPTLGPMDYFFVALVINALIAFGILYGLAIFYRKNSALHARFMVCTAFPLFTPATDRIIHIFFKPMVKYLPTLEGNPIAPVVGFFLADMLLVGLCIWDWKSHKRLTVFPIALLILLLYHYSVLNFHQYEFWKSFSVWLVG